MPKLTVNTGPLKGRTFPGLLHYLDAEAAHQAASRKRGRTLAAKLKQITLDT